MAYVSKRAIKDITKGKAWKYDTKTDTLTIPGLRDCHTHPFIYSLLRAVKQIDITGCKTLAELQKALKERKGSGLIFGLGLDTNNLHKLSRSELDEISKEDIVILIDPSFHGGVLNSKAASIIETNSKGNDLNGSLNSDGQWKGEQYLDLCLDLGANCIDREELYLEVVTWVNEQRSRGVVEIHDMKVPSILGLDILAQAREDLGDNFPVTNVHVGVLSAAELIKHSKLRMRLLDKFNIGLKLFSDGSIGSFTAAMEKPYFGTENRGKIFQELESLSQFIDTMKTATLRDLFSHGAVHAIGDRGIKHAFNIAVMLRERLGIQTRIEHFEISRRIELIALARGLFDYGALLQVTLNPNFAPYDFEKYHERLGDRIQQLNPLRKILNFQIPMRFGTDGMPQDMFRAVYDAVNHPVEDQRLTLDEALQIAAGVVSLEEAKQTVSIKGPLAESLISGIKYSNDGEVKINE